MTNKTYSLSISAQAILDMHSLNNEGSEGNQTFTRMVNIIGRDPNDSTNKLELHNVNAVSGDMFKHILAEHLHRISVGNNLPLCAGCREFNANRISADPDFESYVSNRDVSDAEAIKRLLETCAMDDILGNLITTGNRSLPRKSLVEFGWVVAVPGLNATDSYFHAKYARERSEARREADTSETSRRSNLGQNIFHRPASSGVYAVVATIEPSRIGFNDITQEYVIDEEQRVVRYKALLESLLYTFIQPNGAMRSTQHPHLVELSGVVSVSSQLVPAPNLSPLNQDYEQELGRIRDSLNNIKADAIRLEPFDSLAKFSEVITNLITTTGPYALTYSG